MDVLKITEGKLVKARAKGVHVDEIRQMRLVDVLFNNKFFKAYADCVTGSLYDPKTKECLSSANLRIVHVKQN
jgi:hypothetical protein